MIEAMYWLSKVNGLGPRGIKKIVDSESDLALLWEASYQELISEWNIDYKTAREMINVRDKVKINDELSRMSERGVKLLSLYDVLYPDQLKEVYDPPAILYVKGDLDLLNMDKSKMIGVVGTRKPTPYGRKMTKQLVEDLISGDMVVVSGMAKGIDEIAHNTCLVFSGRTIAVLGSGCDVVYPKSNAYIYEGILSGGGLIVSEFPPGTQPLRHHFPRRNRIISGMSEAVLVVEAGVKSGSLITAKYAMEQGRTVMAVPGNVTSPLSRGTLKIIKEGATPVGTAKEILDELDLTINIGAVHEDLRTTSLEKSLALIEPATADQISSLLEMDVYDIMMQLTLLEVKGRVKRLPGGLYVCE